MRCPTMLVLLCLSFVLHRCLGYAPVPAVLFVLHEAAVLVKGMTVLLALGLERYSHGQA